MPAQTVAGNLRPTHQGASSKTSAINILIAGKLCDFADLLVSQGESGFRSQAYHHAAKVVAALDRPVDEILTREGRTRLIGLPAIGVGIAGAIAEMVTTGHWSQMERLRGELAPEALFRTIPGIGKKLARRLADEGHLESLEDLEHAVHFGDLVVEGFGPRRKRMIAAALAERLGRPIFVRSGKARSPPVTVLLDVDRMYRERAAEGRLRKIAPRRFNPPAKPGSPSCTPPTVVGISRRSIRTAGWRMS
ncbi:hypothetical protein AAAK29_25970 [Mesorhizobium sp. CCNWLW179-1]|uniref:hypothetical protein n=1 Tax=unclassified Mesorhizobium TaxID=325217 RepID=UPI0030154245